jgi:hypothetical protein
MHQRGHFSNAVRCADFVHVTANLRLRVTFPCTRDRYYRIFSLRMLASASSGSLLRALE